MDFSQEYVTTESLALRPRNVVATAEGAISQTKAKVMAFSISPNQQNLCTLDQLFDEKTGIRVITLKFWSKTQVDFSSFNLD